MPRPPKDAIDTYFAAHAAERTAWQSLTAEQQEIVTRVRKWATRLAAPVNGPVPAPTIGGPRQRRERKLREAREAVRLVERPLRAGEARLTFDGDPHAVIAVGQYRQGLKPGYVVSRGETILASGLKLGAFASKREAVDSAAREVYGWAVEHHEQALADWARTYVIGEEQ